MPTPAQITSSLFRHWQTACPADLPTLWPGRRASPQQWSQWCELRVDSWTQPHQRLGRTQLACVVTLTLTVRNSTSLSTSNQQTAAQRLDQLADQLTQAWNQQTIPLYEETGDIPTAATPIGYLRCIEVTSQTLPTPTPLELRQELIITARTI